MLVEVRPDARGGVAPAARRARACSGLTTRLILTYAEHAGGRSAVDAVLERAGLRDAEERLRDENAWFAFETKIALWEAAEHALDDRAVAEHAGAAALELGVASGLKRALRALGTPELVYRNVARANAKFNWAHTLEATEVRDGRARLRYLDVSDTGYHRYDCEYTAGLLRTVPQLFGLPPARVAHPSCGVRGDGACEFDVEWVAGAHGIRRAAAGLTLAAAAACGASAAAAPGLLPAVGVVTAAGGALLARRAIGYARGRLEALERRVREQDEATERLVSSLGDLSSDLHIGEVLDKIAGRAQTAVGGKEYALLLLDGDRMRADRHSGVPAASLAALEAWTAVERGALLARPLIVDDVSRVPALAQLASDPALPLGSLCAAALVFRDDLLGVLVALAHGAGVFLPHERDGLAAYATQAAIALSNARLVERLERQAAEDPLTGLANPRTFHRACTAELSRAEREGRPLSVVAIDLDFFKAINDTHGHPYGDEVLCAVADALRAAVRPHDTVARLGGEEFALLLPGAGPGDAEAIAERARAAIAALPTRGDALTSSAGVASHPAHGADPSELLRLADRALYRAKDSGRDQTVVYGGDGADRRRRRQERREIEALLEPRAIEPVFQPAIALSTGTLVAYEALARFPALADRPIPDVFAQAHRLGLGPRLEAAAVRAALAVEGRPPGTRLSVNLSLSALCADEVWDALPESLHGLVVEITEHELFESDLRLVRNLGELRERGARIALDDAGAGYAGLQQLMRVRPDIVKLDRSLVAGVAHDAARAALIASFVGFALQTGGAVCAEGIECLADLRTLAELDVTYAQGHLVGRPAAPWCAVAEEPAAAVAAPVQAGMRLVGAPGPSAATPSEPAPRVDVERLVAIVAASVGADAVELWRLDPEREELVAVHTASGPGARQPLADAPGWAHVLRTRRAGQVIRGDAPCDVRERRRLAAAGFGSMLLTPIDDGGDARGVVMCATRSMRPWSRGAVGRIQAQATPLAAALRPGAPRASVST